MDKKIVLKNVFFDGAKRDILIVGNLFEKVTRPLEPADYEGAEIVDCSHFAIMPAFYNGHTHASMSLVARFC